MVISVINLFLICYIRCRQKLCFRQKCRLKQNHRFSSFEFFIIDLFFLSLVLEKVGKNQSKFQNTALLLVDIQIWIYFYGLTLQKDDFSTWLFFNILLIKINPNTFFKLVKVGGLISESFSLWLKSPKKGAKSLS